MTLRILHMMMRNHANSAVSVARRLRHAADRCSPPVQVTLEIAILAPTRHRTGATRKWTSPVIDCLRLRLCLCLRLRLAVSCLTG